MFRSQSRRHVGMCARVAALSLALGVATPLLGQQSDSTAGRPDFTPSITFLGSLETNPERLPGETGRTKFFSASGELPFRVDSPRWTFTLTYRPEYQYNQDDDALTSFDHSGSFALRGKLSPRTDVEIEGDAYASNELRGLDANDIVVPRSRRVRGTVDGELRQRLSTRDTLRFRGGYERLSFPDGDFIDSDTGYAGASYSHAVSARTSLSLGGNVRLATFDSGTRSRSMTTTVGGLFQLAERTDFEVSGGALWIQQDAGEGWLGVEQPGFTVRGRLRHRLERVSLQLLGERDLGTSSGLGQATLRDRIVGSVGWSDNRWGLVGLGGYSRNRGFSSGAVDGPTIQTLSACGRTAVRVSRAVAVVGVLAYAHQLGEIVQDTTDTFRVSLGVRLQANGLPLALASSTNDFSRIGRSARASC
ncbi:MAG: hypothetical protein GKS06_04560 [Acidobacteria bacterium]|nr:hypothetical protein [Acidobacteriota bacterium]